jgi:hypothetical protein
MRFFGLLQSRFARLPLLEGVRMSKSDSNTLPKPPRPEYDRFGFQNNLKRSDSVHWSRPWTAETEHARTDTEILKRAPIKREQF